MSDIPTSAECAAIAVRLVGDSMDREWLDRDERLNYATQAQVWATLALLQERGGL